MEKKELTDHQIQQRGIALGYKGEFALNTSGQWDEDECGMVAAEIEAGKSLDAAIHEVVRTRKYREDKI